VELWNSGALDRHKVRAGHSGVHPSNTEDRKLFNRALAESGV
jgi:hypothetical protein